MGVYVPSDRGVLHIPTATRVGRDAISEDFDQLVLFLLVYRRREGFCRAEDRGMPCLAARNPGHVPIYCSRQFLQRLRSPMMTTSARLLVGNGGMGYRDYYKGLLRDYHRDPFPTKNQTDMPVIRSVPFNSASV